MDQRQWQEVFSIVRKHQQNQFGGSRYSQKEYDSLTTILNELYSFAYDELPTPSR